MNEPYKFQVGHTVEFIGESPNVLQGEVGEVVATAAGFAKVKFKYTKRFIWESWFLVDHLRQRE